VDVTERLRPAWVHLVQHSTLSEQELTGLLGARGARSFSRRVEALAKAAGLRLTLQVVNGLKQYGVA
jgi:hypothetical protein